MNTLKNKTNNKINKRIKIYSNSEIVKIVFKKTIRKTPICILFFSITFFSIFMKIYSTTNFVMGSNQNQGHNSHAQKKGR